MPNWKAVVGIFTVGIVGLTTMVAVGYATTPLPTEAQKGVQDEGSTVYYADQKTPVERLGAKRQILTHDQIPAVVRDAVLAIEDDGFYTEPGISIRGIARAVSNNATGGDTQGASTITQQLARNYYAALSQDKSLSRKAKEIFISIKLSKSMSKDKILDLYLNTVPFGRQSSGIGMASLRYFHQPASKLTVGQAAMLAALIQRPGYFQTQGNAAPALALQSRWRTVITNLVSQKKLTQADADKALAKYPKTADTWDDTKDTPQTVYLKQEIDKELAQVKGLTQEMIESGGYKVYTSIDQTWMKYAEQAMNEQGVKKWPKNIGTGLIAVDPANGEIKAFYGGDPSRNGSYDTVFNPSAQVGSSFKPYVLATALKNNFSIKSMIDGHSPQTFDQQGNDLGIHGKGYRVQNDSGDGPMGVITLVKATEMSVNTAYVKLNLLMKPQEVARTAESFGVPATYLNTNHFNELGGLALGIANIPAVYQASGYAAFANGGTAVTPHLITKVVDKSGKKIPLPWKSHRVLTADQAAQATVAMRAVVTTGTGTKANIPGRPVAGKTGTTEENKAAWFVGYTPQLSAAVTMFNTKNKTITGIPGYQSSVYGGTIPAAIWKSFMMKVAAKAKWEPKEFPVPTYDGSAKQLWDTPKPTPSPTTTAPTPNPDDTCRPGERFHHGQPCPQSPQSPPPTSGQPCSQAGLPIGCDPNTPPSDPPPSWFCTKYSASHGGQIYQGCPQTDPNGPGGPVKPPKTQSRTLVRIED